MRLVSDNLSVKISVKNVKKKAVNGRNSRTLDSLALAFFLNRATYRPRVTSVMWHKTAAVAVGGAAYMNTAWSKHGP